MSRQISPRRAAAAHAYAKNYADCYSWFSCKTYAGCYAEAYARALTFNYKGGKRVRLYPWLDPVKGAKLKVWLDPTYARKSRRLRRQFS